MPRSILGLTIDIDAKSDKFNRQAKNFRSKTKGMGRDIDKMGGKASSLGKKLAAAFSVAALSIFTKKLASATNSALDFVDTIGKNADRIGISTTKLQQYVFAADLAGVSQEILTKALKKMNDNLGDAALNGGATARALSQLGVAIQEGAAPADNFENIVRALAGIEDQTKKAALANDVFGRAGAELLTLIGKVPGGLDDAIVKFDDFGLAVNDGLIENSEDAKDSLALLTRQISAIKINTLLAFATAINSVATAVAGLGKTVSEFASDKRNLFTETFSGWSKIIDRFVASQKKAGSFSSTFFAEENQKRDLDFLDGIAQRLHAAAEAGRDFEAPDLTGLPGVEKPETEPPAEPFLMPEVLITEQPLPKPKVDLSAFQQALSVAGGKSFAAPISILLDESKVNDAMENYEKFAAQIKERTTALGEIWKNTQDGFIDGFSSAFARVLVYGESFADSMRSLMLALIADIIKELAKIALLKTVFSFFGGGGIAGGALNLGTPAMPAIPTDMTGFSGGLGGLQRMAPRQQVQASQPAPIAATLQINERTLGKVILEMARNGAIAGGGLKIEPSLI